MNILLGFGKLATIVNCDAFFFEEKDLKFKDLAQHILDVKSTPLANLTHLNMLKYVPSRLRGCSQIILLFLPHEIN